MFDAAIFDMDGLLIDSERAIMRLWLEASAQLGRALSEAEYLPIIGRAAPDCAAILSELLGKKRFERAARQVYDAAISADPAVLFPQKPGARLILSLLREKGIRCAVASSTISAEVRRRLTAVGLLEFFDVAVGGDQVSKGKPDPALYRLATEMLASEPGRCLAFEDSENGVASAAAAQVKVVHIPDLKPPSSASQALSFEVLTSLTAAISRVDCWFPSHDRAGRSRECAHKIA
jgi:HAD superfamily hydrolase (TIGR01509 family)